MQERQFNYIWHKKTESCIATSFLVSKDKNKIIYDNIKSTLILPTKKSKLKFRCDTLNHADFLAHQFIKINKIILESEHYINN